MTGIISSGSVGDGTERKPLFTLTIQHVEDWPTHLRLPTRHFGLFLACDGTVETDDALRAMAATALRQGLAYVCTWGPDCERVHDLFDSIRDAFDSDATDESVVMTTWHDDESLEDALWYFLFAAMPATGYQGKPMSLVACIVGREDWDAVTKQRFEDPLSRHSP